MSKNLQFLDLNYLEFYLFGVLRLQCQKLCKHIKEVTYLYKEIIVLNYFLVKVVAYCSVGAWYIFSGY